MHACTASHAFHCNCNCNHVFQFEINHMCMCMSQGTPGSPRFEGVVPHDHPAAACNCHQFDPSVRTCPSECDHPSQHLTHGAVGGLGIPVWRWADVQLANEHRAVAKELNARSAMANKRQILAGAESSAIPFSPVRASAGLDARPPPEERRGLVRVEHCRGMTCRHHSPQAAQTASTNTLGGTAGAEPLMTPLAEPQSRRGLGHGRCAAKVPQLPQL